MLDPGAETQRNTKKIGTYENPEEFRESVYDFWKSIVKIYTGCNLTKGDDKLVAVAGIAREIHGYLGGDDEYLVGLWRNELFVQLSWRAEHPWKARPKTYRASTWSWASVDAPIEFLPQRSLAYWRDFSNSLVSFEIDKSTTDEFGQVTSGSIRITGPMKTLVCTYNPHETYQDPKFRCKLKTTHPYEHGPTNSAPFVYWDVANDPEESSLVHEKREIHRLHWMPFFPKDPYTKTANIYGLILQPTGVLKGQFKRLGVLQVMGPQLSSSMDVSRLATPDPQDSWLEYEEFDGTDYTISII
jgi:hypothetical protein